MRQQVFVFARAQTSENSNCGVRRKSEAELGNEKWFGREEQPCWHDDDGDLREQVCVHVNRRFNSRAHTYTLTRRRCCQLCRRNNANCLKFANRKEPQRRHRQPATNDKIRTMRKINRLLHTSESSARESATHRRQGGEFVGVLLTGCGCGKPASKFVRVHLGRRHGLARATMKASFVRSKS